MRRIILVACCVAAASLVATSSASAGGINCGRTSADDNAGNVARFSVKSYDVGCTRSDKTLKSFWEAVDGEQGVTKKIKGFVCGPLQKYSVGGLAFQCRPKNGGAKRFKAHWVSLTHS